MREKRIDKKRVAQRYPQLLGEDIPLVYERGGYILIESGVHFLYQGCHVMSCHGVVWCGVPLDIKESQ